MSQSSTSAPTHTHKPRPLIDMLVSILIPSGIMMYLSSDAYLGADRALALALAFPLGWGFFELAYYRKFNWIALLGLVSLLLTGGIGLLHLDAGWLAIKEAAVPAIIGVAVLVSTKTPYPLIRTLLYNHKVLNVDKIQEHLEQGGHCQEFEKRLQRATYLLSSTFFFSAAMNYLLARLIVVSPSGSEAFNNELGQMTLYSYPVIALPCMLMMMGTLYYIWKTIHGLTGLSMEEIIAPHHHEQSQDSDPN